MLGPKSVSSLESELKQNFIRNYIILDIKYDVLDFVYDLNHYFGWGQILKPKLANTFIQGLLNIVVPVSSDTVTNTQTTF